MISLLKRIFLDNWQRKLISLILAMVVWILVNHSMTSQKTLHNVSVKVVNLPKGHTIEGIQPDGFIKDKLTITATGNKNTLEELSGSNLVAIIDASNQTGRWIAPISKKNLKSIDSNIDIQGKISKISRSNVIVKLNKLVTEKIPVLVTEPIGEPPKGYQYLDLWPYHLTMTVTGPEDAVKHLKTTGAKLTFNLSDINQDDLNLLYQKQNREEISYLIPETWKKLLIPALSSIPFQIDDVKANQLRIDFVKTELIPLKKPIPLSLFFPLKYSSTLNPNSISLHSSGIVENRSGVKLINAPLYACGVSRRFVDIVKDKIQINVLVAPKSERENLLWNVEFIYPNDLENRYVASMLADAKEKGLFDSSIQMIEQHLRVRFRNYMSKFRLYNQKNQKLQLHIELKNGSIVVQPHRKK
jgi:hypothetical protein